MRWLFLVALTVVTLSSPALAQQWIPPRPGGDMCSGWVDAGHRQACFAKEAEDQARDEHRRQVERDRVNAIVGAEKSRLAAEREAAAARQQQALAEMAAQRRADADAAEARKAAEQRSQAERLARTQAAAAEDAADAFKRVDPLDLKVSPDDFLGRSLKISGLRCYAPSPTGRRCIDDQALVLVQLSAIEPVEVQRLIDHACTSFRVAMNDDACRWTARFVLDDYSFKRTDEGERVVVLLPEHVDLSQER